MMCDICGLILEGTMIGNGDGAGQKFAHPECFYREKCFRLEEQVKQLIYANQVLKDDVEYYKMRCEL